ncbi:probable tyrosine-protein kinase DDB_G0290471 isoform X2 [Lytechinus variegatus]|uniref:probable tyrosine-protein kinase DDB_G0290471 isoform X2 n=1 Tax=Lytechinus variegatus TaxID=7654 RepID=UPI001BB11678|nr:probable tyrosine-protein kinase DDB_G0290471 isoform X2 [Lytechinus variegatus]
MSVLSQIISIVKFAKQVHDAVEEVQRFKERSRTLNKYVELIVQPLEILREKCSPEELERHRPSQPGGSGDAADGSERPWKPMLLEFQNCIERILKFLKKLSNQWWITKIFKKDGIRYTFDGFNNSLMTLGQGLILSLQTEFRTLFTDELVKQWETTFNLLNLLQNDVNDIKADQKTQEGHIKYSDLSDVKNLHEGKYGPIYMAKHKCEDKMLVFKTFEDNGVAARKELKDQCRMWKMLNFSRFIVHLYGYTIDDNGCMCFVVEYMPLGTLRSVLLDEDKHQLPWERRKKIAWDCAQGLAAIHYGQAKTLLHRAITSNRFMLNEDYRAKISDNGFVKSGSKISTSKSSATYRGSLDDDETNYLCPEETVEPFKRTIKSEVYKLGIVFYEIAARKRPFQAMEERDAKQMEKVMKWKFTKKGKKEEPPSDTPEDFKQLINLCREKDQCNRPSTNDVVCTLEKMCVPELDE